MMNKIMKQLFAGITCALLSTYISYGQNPINLGVYEKFKRLEKTNGKSCVLSANGNFVLFKKRIGQQIITTTLKNIRSGAEKFFLTTHNEQCLNNDTMFAFQVGTDSLAIFDTTREALYYIKNVKSYFIIRHNQRDAIAYFSEKNGEGLLTIWDTHKGRVKELSDVKRGFFWLNRQGTGLLTMGEQGATYTDLNTFRQKKITPSTNIECVAYSDSGMELAYILKSEHGSELRYSNIASGESRLLLADTSSFLGQKWKLGTSELSFNNNDGNVFFKIFRKDGYFGTICSTVITKDVNIWSYQDAYLHEKQLVDLKKGIAYTSMINIKSKKALQLENDSTKLEYLGNTARQFILTTSINDNEFYWNRQKIGLYLFSSITGEKQLIKRFDSPGFTVVGITGNERFLVWFDGKDGNYYSYDIVSEKILNISKLAGRAFQMLSQRDETAELLVRSDPYNGRYWINNGQALIVHSKYDIWQLDPEGLKKPICLTMGYGEANNIRFRLANPEFGTLVKADDKGTLAYGFDNRNKQNGFWKIYISRSIQPVKLCMSDDAYYFSPESPILSSNISEDPREFYPVKAGNANTFVIRKMNSSNAPNLYATRDFKNFKQISDIKADSRFVSIKSKLIRYTLPNGKQIEGVLHLPYNLDSTKSYPIIFNYYERRSEGLNLYRTPEITGHNINIPWYVNLGYLVFEPDFYYERGETSKSVIDAVKSSVTELAKLQYVDTARMGAQGQSFGGYESNVLAIQTSLFKAVCSMAGPTNIISEYGSIRPRGSNNQFSADIGQRNLGAFPWDQPQVFVQNSPNFHIRNAITPLLLVHNKGDDAILFPQAIELYLGMRRLGKKVWLLEYDKEGHAIFGEENKLDFTIRMQQFFDHYLKGAPAPRWMTRGVPAAMKGIDSGLELDAEIKTPGEGIARPVAPGKIF